MSLELRCRFCWRGMTVAHWMTEYYSVVLMQPVGNLSSGTCQISACCGGAGGAVHREPLASMLCRSQALGKLQVLQYPEALCLLPSCLGVSAGARGELLVTGGCWLPCPAGTQEWKSLMPEKVMQKETAKPIHRNQEGNLFSSCNISSALS